jgi:LysM repeat protein
MPVRPVPAMPAADTMPEGTLRGVAGQGVAPSAVAVAPPAAGLPPLGAPSAVSTPAITPPLPLPGQPKVESYDEEVYHCKPGDTFASVAQQYYHNPKYEKALLLFNRNHPMAGDGLKSDNPTLQPNDVIHIPPAKILENRYGTAVPDLSPLPPPGAAAPNPAGAAAPLPVAGPVTTNSPPATRNYQVQTKDGEMLYRIAEQQLGNGNRWMELHDLNPTWEPAQPVPAGTVLRLPAQ